MEPRLNLQKPGLSELPLNTQPLETVTDKIFPSDVNIILFTDQMYP